MFIRNNFLPVLVFVLTPKLACFKCHKMMIYMPTLLKIVMLCTLLAACAGEAVHPSSQGESRQSLSSQNPSSQSQSNQSQSSQSAASIGQTSSTDIASSSHQASSSSESTALAPELMPESPWTFLSLSASAAYGTRHFHVPASQHWVNTGLFLRQGESVTITAEGTWSMDGNEYLTAEGKAGGKVFRGCTLGSLVARIGLFYEDAEITCVGAQAEFVAPKEGIVFLGAILSTDLGETYEDRRNADGEMRVSLTSSTGHVVPTIPVANAQAYDYSLVSSGWVEIMGTYNILTLPADIAGSDKETLVRAVNRLDAMYQLQAEFRGLQPYNGQPIRWMGDTKDAPGWMLAGSPVRLDPSIIDGDIAVRITHAGETYNDTWGYAHELGHIFNFAGGDWYYTTFGGLEAWPNIFALYTVEQLGLPVNDALSNCAERKTHYLADVKTPFNDDPWVGMCFFKHLREQHGWEIFKQFYAEFNNNPGFGWGFLRDRLSRSANSDLNPIFDEWQLPQ